MYAAQIDNDGAITQVLVAAAAWATEHLGGQWVDLPPGVDAGPGWTWNGAAPQPPTPPSDAHSDVDA